MGEIILSQKRLNTSCLLDTSVTFEGMWREILVVKGCYALWVYTVRVLDVARWVLDVCYWQCLGSMVLAACDWKCIVESVLLGVHCWECINLGTRVFWPNILIVWVYSRLKQIYKIRVIMICIIGEFVLGQVRILNEYSKRLSSIAPRSKSSNKALQ